MNRASLFCLAAVPALPAGGDPVLLLGIAMMLAGAAMWPRRSPDHGR